MKNCFPLQVHYMWNYLYAFMLIEQNLCFKFEIFKKIGAKALNIFNLCKYFC